MYAFERLKEFDKGHFDNAIEFLVAWSKKLGITAERMTLLDIGCGSEESLDSSHFFIFYPYLCLAAASLGMKSFGIDSAPPAKTSEYFNYIQADLVTILSERSLENYLLNTVGLTKFSIVNSTLLTGSGEGSPRLKTRLKFTHESMEGFGTRLRSEAEKLVSRPGFLVLEGKEIYHSI